MASTGAVRTQVEIDFARGADLPETGIYRESFGNFYKDGSLSPNGDVEHLSNLIDHWVDIPKYCMTARIQYKNRSPEGMLQSVTREFSKGNGTMTMRPARLEDPKTGKEMDFYPTPTDEIIEYILIKMLADPHKGVYTNTTNNQKEALVRFRLRDISRMLEEHGYQRNRADIKRSLYVLAGTQYTMKFGNGKPITDRIISSLIDGGNGGYWTVRFPLFISGAIAANAYRQFPFTTYLRLTCGAARWLLTRMSMQKNFGAEHPHKFCLSEALEQGVVNCKTVRDNVRQLRDAISELCEMGCLDEADIHLNPLKRIRDNGKTVDVQFTLPCNNYMRSHAMAANARQRDTKILKQRNPAAPMLA